MKYIKEYAFSALAILMASCSSDNDTIEPVAEKTPVSSSNSMSFSASIESGTAGSKATRTTLSNTDNPYPIWSSGDQIKVYNLATDDAQLFDISSSDVGKRAANFTGNINVKTGENANNKFYALYAGNVAASSGAPTIALSGENVTISGTIPSTQSSTPGFHSDLHFMTACTTGSAFSFKNAMALMKVTISDNNYSNFQITKIILKSNNSDEKIAGDFTATIGDNGTLSNYSVTNGSSEIVIDNGTSALATGTYYIAINPCAFSSGFTLSFHENSANGNLKEYDRVKDASFPVAASEIIDLGSYTAKECAKEAYVDLGLTNSAGQKVLWGIENVYDDNANSTVNASYYSWGETLVKANQDKDTECQNYSWNYSYGIGTGSDESSLSQRSYKYGIGEGGGPTVINRWNFPRSSKATGQSGRWFGLDDQSGTLLKYNSLEDYSTSIADWGGGVQDNKTELEVVDDAAYQKSNGKLRIPSEADFQMLIDNADNETNSTKMLVCEPSAGSNYKLYKFKNRATGHYIEFPINGYMFTSSSSDTQPQKQTEWGYYWTRNRASAAADSYKARAFKIVVTGSDAGASILDAERAAGRMLRGVIYK